MQKTDLVFLKRFAQIIGGLFVLTLLLIVLANLIYSKTGLRSENKQNDIGVEKRIAPVGSVYSGDTGRAAIVAAQEAAARAMSSKVAFDGSLDGELIYNNVCSACHNAGRPVGPNPTREEWAPRIAQGLEILNKHAVEGYKGQVGQMPAKGGRPDLSEEQIKVSIEYMVKKYQG